MFLIPFILFIVILSVLVFVHELGHFVSARMFGIKVDEFGIGIPPRAWSKKIGDVVYSLNWLPLGGFVSIRGENFDGYDPKDKSNFMNKKPWKQAVVLTAGVAMNFVLGVLIFYGLLASNGFRSNPIVQLGEYKFPYGQTEVLGNIVTYIAEDSPAKSAGMEFGERIISLDSIQNSAKGIAYPANPDELKEYLLQEEGNEVVVTTESMIDETQSTYTVIPEYSENLGHAAIGVGLGEALEIAYVTPMQKAFSGFLHSANLLAYTYKAFGELIGQSIEEGSPAAVSQGVAGPVGIFGMVQAVSAVGGIHAVIGLLELSAIMSLSFAVMNLLPIPALDGGRLVFVALEMFTGKRPSAKLEAKAHQIGYAFLIGLIILISIKDVFTFF